jgi:hypothetical protein
MAVYLVAWHMNKERPNYAEAHEAFVAHISGYMQIWDDRYETMRFVSSSLTASEVNDDLRTKLEPDDRLFVTKVTKGDYAGFLDPAVWHFIDIRT